MGLPAMKIGQTLITQGRHSEDKFSNWEDLKNPFFLTNPNYATVVVDLTVYSHVIPYILESNPHPNLIRTRI